MTNTNTAAANDTSAIRVGETLEIPGFRIHCYVNSLVVTDLEHAGKRGRTVRELVVICKNPAGFAPAILTQLQEEGFEGAKVFAGECALGRMCEVEHRALRGVDVAPAGILDESLRIGRFAINLSWDSFSFRDEKDPNLSTVYGTSRKDAAKVRAWVKSSAAFIEGMTLRGVENVLSDVGIKSRHYCGMD